VKVDEAALVREILEGDTEAFRIIVEQHQTRVFYLGLKFLKGREEAEDFAQEVFLRAFERLDTYKGDGAFAGWLYRIAFNLAATKYRAARRFPTESWDEERDSPSGGGSLSGERSTSYSALRTSIGGDRERTGEVEQRVIHAESVDEVNQALKKIPGPYALLVKMHFYDGLTYPEISEILSMPINTIKSYIHRAKKSIRRLLAGHGYAEAK
jgi:RNA polymerase sigma-70 factor (ECF subfamily)